MKLTKLQLKRLIKEEINQVLNEDDADTPTPSDDGDTPEYIEMLKNYLLKNLEEIGWPSKDDVVGFVESESRGDMLRSIVRVLDMHTTKGYLARHQKSWSGKEDV